jgi:hypothetical protein
MGPEGLRVVVACARERTHGAPPPPSQLVEDFATSERGKVRQHAKEEREKKAR